MVVNFAKLPELLRRRPPARKRRRAAVPASRQARTGFAWHGALKRQSQYPQRSRPLSCAAMPVGLRCRGPPVSSRMLIGA